MCITGHEIYNGQRQNVSGHLQAHLGWANGQPGRKDFAYLFNFFSKPTLATFVYNEFFFSAMFDENLCQLYHGLYPGNCPLKILLPIPS
jgi:hypothetical protein